MPQLLDRSQVSTTIVVPLDLIEAETLSLLGVEIIDIEDNIDDCIPRAISAIGYNGAKPSY
jgi:hypothetical protein